MDTGSLAAALESLDFAPTGGPRERLATARRLERAAREAGRTADEMRARVIAADLLQRSGAVDEGAAIAIEVNGWASEHGPPLLLARSHRVLSLVFEGIGDASSALDHAVLALEALPGDAPSRVRGLYVLRLADALAVAEARDDARSRYGEAASHFRDAGDTASVMTVLNNLAILEHEAADDPAARAAVDAMRAMADGALLDAAYAETAARVYLAAGALADAAEAVDVGRRLLDEKGDVVLATPAELLLTSARVLRARGTSASCSSQTGC